MQHDMYKHEMSLYLQPKHAGRHVAGRVSRRMDSSHAAIHLDVGVSLIMLLSHAARHVCARVSPRMQPEACGLTHKREKERKWLSKSMVDSEGRYSTEKQDSVQSEVLYRERSVPQVQISQSSEVRYSTGRFEELSRSGRRFCPSPDQSVEACQFLHDEAEVMSNSRSAQSSPVKSSIGFWLSLLRSTSCLSPRTL
ncbi:hypothetical protein YC2023_052788 [Brassica napus]